MRNKNSQIASMDVIIALVVFVVIVSFIFGYVLKKTTFSKFEELSMESDILVNKLSSSEESAENDIAIASLGNLDKLKLGIFLDKMILGNKGGFYGSVKSLLGVSSDYCIYFEGDNGTAIYVHELVDNPDVKAAFYNDTLDFPDSILAYGFGSKEIMINGVPCIGE